MTKPKLKNPFPVMGNFFKTKPQIWLAFVIPSAIMAITYIGFGVYPFGNRSVLSLDLNAQYVYYFAYMRDALFGSESILYSWSRNLSGEFVGIIGYYLFSPFNLIVWVFPLSHITTGLLLMILTKIGFIGVTMAVYLSKGRGFSAHTTVLFSVMYALTSYNIVQTMNPMWLDGVMILPLIVLGIESLLKYGRFKLLIFSLFYAFVTCFYIGYMLGIFAALYFIYYALTSRRCNVNNIFVLFKRSGLFTVCAVIAVLLAAFMLLPVYSSLSLGKMGFAENLVEQAAKEGYTVEYNFRLMDLTRKLFLNSYDTVRPNGLPFIYAGTVSLIMIVAYFFCERIRRARRFGGMILIAILTMSMFIKPVDMLWHGMQIPNWLPYRYSFILCFLILAFGAEAFENIRKIPHKVLGGAAIMFGALLLYWTGAETVIADLGDGGRDVFNWIKVVIPALGVLVIFAGFLVLAHDRLNKANMFSAALIVLVSLELLYNTGYSIAKQHVDITYSTRDSFNDVILPTREVTDRLNKEMSANGEFFRMEKTYNRSANDPMALRMKGITHSSSMLNEQSIALLKNLGFSAWSHSSRYLGSTPLVDDLFGFKYVLSCTDNNTANIKSAEDITVSINEDALPIAYLVNTNVSEFAFERGDVFKSQNQLLSAMLGETDNEYFVKMYYTDKRPQNLTHAGLADGYSGYSRGSDPHIDAHIEYDFVVDKAGDVYMYFPSDFERQCNLWIKHNVPEDLPPQFLGQFYGGDHHHVRHLGYFEEGDEFMVTLSLPKGTNDVYFKGELFVRLDRELLEADVARIHAINNTTAFKAVSDRHFKITSNNTQKMMLFTSIPAEPGWRASINGKPAKVVEFGEMFMGKEKQKCPETGREIEVDIFADGLVGVMVPPGENVIELKFFPNMMPLGLLLSLGGIAAFVLLCAIKFKLSANRKKDSESDSAEGLSEVTEVTEPADDYDGYDPDYVNIDDGDFGF